MFLSVDHQILTHWLSFMNVHRFQMLGLLPREIILYIISFYPKRCWFLLSKGFYDLALAGMNNKAKLKALGFACKDGWLNLADKCLQVIKL
jgi:hypothetical protein